eukprot:UN24254
MGWIIRISFEMVYDIQMFNVEYRKQYPTMARFKGIWFAKRLIVTCDIAAFLFLFYAYACDFISFEILILNFGLVLKLVNFSQLSLNQFSESVIFLTWGFVILILFFMFIVLLNGPFINFISLETTVFIVSSLILVPLYDIKKSDVWILGFEYSRLFFGIVSACLFAENILIHVGNFYTF